MIETLKKWFGITPEKETRDIYAPMTKHYVFNETGNIMLCATEDGIHNFDEDIKHSFIDISVFFSAMTKAIHSLEELNPLTGKPYTIYNYRIVKKILESSGMFIEMNVEENIFSSVEVGAKLGKGLIQEVLNRDFSESKLHFAKAMFNGMKYQQADKEIVRQKVEHWDTLEEEQRNEKLRQLNEHGSVFFIGELLLGLPQISAILVKIEPISTELDQKDREEEKAKTQELTKLGGMNDEDYTSKGILRSWNYKKRTYLFVPPQFLKANSSTLANSGSPEYELFVKSLSSQLSEFVKTNSSIEK